MKCAICYFEFDERIMRHSCSGCLKLGGCNMSKCPNCGYESPLEPEWLKRLIRALRKEPNE